MGEYIKISIITVVYNAVDVIEKTLRSIVEQSYTNIEYIVVDAMSTDGTLDILKSYEKNIAVLISEKDQGIYDAMNKAMKIANGDFCIFINAGDVLYNCETIKSFVLNVNDLNVVYYGNVLWKANDKSFVYDGKFNMLKICLHNICHQAIFYPKSIYSEKEFNLNYSLAADYCFNLEIWSCLKFKYINLIICEYSPGLSAQKEDFIFSRDKSDLIRRHFGCLFYICYLVFKYLRIRTYFRK